jgi:hypothetical protein
MPWTTPEMQNEMKQAFMKKYLDSKKTTPSSSNAQTPALKASTEQQERLRI